MNIKKIIIVVTMFCVLIFSPDAPRPAGITPYMPEFGLISIQGTSEKAPFWIKDKPVESKNVLVLSYGFISGVPELTMLCFPHNLIRLIGEYLRNKDARPFDGFDLVLYVKLSETVRNMIDSDPDSKEAFEKKNPLPNKKQIYAQILRESGHVPIEMMVLKPGIARTYAYRGNDFCTFYPDFTQSSLGKISFRHFLEQKLLYLYIKAIRVLRPVDDYWIQYITGDQFHALDESQKTSMRFEPDSGIKVHEPQYPKIGFELQLSPGETIVCAMYVTHERRTKEVIRLYEAHIRESQEKKHLHESQGSKTIAFSIGST